MSDIVGLLLMVLVCSALAACGQTGPLYLPKQQPLPANVKSSKNITKAQHNHKQEKK